MRFVLYRVVVWPIQLVLLGHLTANTAVGTIRKRAKVSTKFGLSLHVSVDVK